MKKLLLLSIIALFALSSCKKWQHKYPEDPERTKLTPEERLTGKWWTLQNVTLNGKDYTDTVMNQIGKFQIYFGLEKVSGISSVRYVGNATSGYEGSFFTTWDFTSDYQNFSFGRYNSGPSIYPYCALYYPYNYDSGFYGMHYLIQRLDNGVFKIALTSKTADSTFTNTFISN
jgi:hypothetical protein